MGPNYSISTACATSNFCILNAANHIIRGEAVSSLPLSRYFQPPTSICFWVNQIGEPYDIPSVLPSLILMTVDIFQDMMLCGGSDAAIIPIGNYPSNFTYDFPMSQS